MPSPSVIEAIVACVLVTAVLVGAGVFLYFNNKTLRSLNEKFKE